MPQAASAPAPHLHFEIHDDCPDTCGVFEPFAGDCRPGESGWVEQPPLDRSAYLHDFGVTYEDINAFGPWPFTWPRTGQIALSDPNVKIWWYGTALPAGSNWRVSFVRPNGTIATNGVTQSFGNPFWRWYNWWWTYTVTDMHSITGTWKVRLFINNVQVIEAPIEVVAVRDPGFNRAPEPIVVEFDPPDPQVGEVLTCLVNTSLTLDDLDYDIVRYEYVWTVNGNEVRHVTTAAHSDVLSRDYLNGPVQVQCTVTPSDGVAAGQGDSVNVNVHSSVPAISTWGLICLGLFVLTAGSLVVLRRQPGAAEPDELTQDHLLNLVP